MIKHSARPSTVLSTSVVVLVTLIWGVLRLWVFQASLFPLTYVLPLMLCVWSRRRWQLWTMAVVFAAMTTAKVYWVIPAVAPTSDRDFAAYAATLFNIVIGAVAVQVMLFFRNRIDARNERILQQNAELETQTEELSQQNEEIRAQAEELAQQNEEIESQAEELARQNEDLHESNQRSSSREEVLQAVAQCSRQAGGGRLALDEISHRALRAIGSPAEALLVLEQEGDSLIIRSQAALGERSVWAEAWPIKDSVVEVVLKQDKTAYIDDLLKRPDLATPFRAIDGFRSALATPLRMKGVAAGALLVCSRQAAHWSQEQFRLVEWIAAQCGLILEGMRWQDELRERAEAIDAANRAKDDFLATLSHELRTPLTPVLAAAGALAVDERLPAEIRDDIEMIRRNVAVQSRLIDDLLDLTRIARGKMDLNQERLEIRALLEEVVLIVRSDLEQQEQTLDLALNLTRETIVVGDGARLKQVFWNLLKNSIKFSPRKSHILLTASLAQTDGIDAVTRLRRPHGTVVIRFADQGVGIEATDLARIFLPFEQAAEARRRGSSAGLGLGLSIAKAITELHDGTIQVSSDGHGRGATFTVELPLASLETGGKTSSGLPDNRAVVLTNGARRKILLVEDHEDTGRVMARLLKRDGHDVTHVVDMAGALKVWGVQPFDLVVSDLGLPDGSGLDLMKQIRERDAKVPGICMSGFGMEADVQASRAVGFTDHLIKPVEIGQLRAAIRRLAERSGGAHA